MQRGILKKVTETAGETPMLDACSVPGRTIRVHGVVCLLCVRRVDELGSVFEFNPW